MTRNTSGRYAAEAPARVRCAPRSASLAAAIAQGLTGALLLCSTVGTAEPAQPPASSNNSLPGGLVLVIENKPQKNGWLNPQALNNPYIRGVALQIRWRDIEPVEGEPDWSRLDQLFAAAESSNKWVQLLIFPGFFSPPWALEDAETEEFPIQYGPGQGTLEKLPMPWDKVYLGRWFAFVKQLGDRYGKSPALKVISAVGPTSVSAESTLPSTQEDVQKWLKDGYTPRKYIAAWHETFQVYAADFPNQYISLSLGYGLNINEKGKLDARERMRVKQAVVDEAIGQLGRRFVLQYSNLDGNPGRDRGPQGTAFVMSYKGRAITGFQLRTSCERNSGNMGAEGDPPLALRRSIDKGMQPDKAGRRVNYLEIYEPDVVAADMQPVLRYGASLFAPW